MSLRQLLRDFDAGLEAWWPYLLYLGALFGSLSALFGFFAAFIIHLVYLKEGAYPVFVTAPWNYINDNTGVTIAAACLAFAAMLGAMTLYGRRIRRRRETAKERAKSAPASQSQRPKPNVNRPVKTAAGAVPSAKRDANPHAPTAPRPASASTGTAPRRTETPWRASLITQELEQQVAATTGGRRPVRNRAGRIVMARVSKRRCTDSCQYAKGPTCACSCGGINHGIRNSI